MLFVETLLHEFAEHEQHYHKMTATKVSDSPAVSVVEDTISSRGVPQRITTENYARFAFNLGRIMSDAGNWSSALHHYTKAFDAYKSDSSGSSSNAYSIACCHVSLAKVRLKMFQANVAEEHLANALAMQEKFVGMHYFAKLINEYTSITELTLSELELGLRMANELLSQEGNNVSVAQIYLARPTDEEWAFGVWITSTASTYRGLAAMYTCRGHYPEALRYLEKAHTIYECLNDDSEQCPYFKRVSRPYLLAKTLSAIADIQFNLGERQISLEYHSRALKIREDTLGHNHPSTAESNMKFGVVASSLGQSDRAMRSIRKAVSICEENEGVDHESTAAGYVGLGIVHRDLGDFENAIRFHTRAADIRRNQLGPDHPGTAEALAELSFTHSAAGAVYAAAASKCFHNAYGPVHPESRRLEAATDVLNELQTSAAMKCCCSIQKTHTTLPSKVNGYDDSEHGRAALREIVTTVSRKISDIRRSNNEKEGSGLFSLSFGDINTSALGNPCFAGTCTLTTAMGPSSIEDICKGDLVLTASGNFTSVVCVVVSPCVDGRAHLVKFPNGLKITPFHPIYTHGHWRFPKDVASVEYGVTCDAVYNLVLSDEHNVIVNGVQCVTLGHGLDCSEVVEHPYFGTTKVINDLRQCSGWDQGTVVVRKMQRDLKTNLVNGMKSGGLQQCLQVHSM